MKRKPRFFSIEFKQGVVQEYLDGDLSQSEVLKKYDLGRGSQITNWMRKFGLQTPKSTQIITSQPMPEPIKKSFKELELEAQNEELRKQLEYEQLRVLALNTLIDVAERDLKIPIRKKPGTKQ